MLLRQKSQASGDVGAAAVEFALIVVLFVALLAGVIQFGYTFFEYIQVAHAAREGVRWAALGVPEQVVTRARQAAPGLKPLLMDIQPVPPSSPGAVRIRVTYPTTMLIPLPHGLILPDVITSEAEERLE